MRAVSLLFQKSAERSQETERARYERGELQGAPSGARDTSEYRARSGFCVLPRDEYTITKKVHYKIKNV